MHLLKIHVKYIHFRSRRTLNTSYRSARDHLLDRRIYIPGAHLYLTAILAVWPQMLDFCFQLELPNIFISQVGILDLRQKRTFWPTPGSVGAAGPPSFCKELFQNIDLIFWIATFIRWSNYREPDGRSRILPNGASRLIQHLMAR